MKFRIEGYKGYTIPEGYGVIYEYYIPSLGKSYIGQTTNLFRRHFAHRKRGKLAPYLQADDYILNILATVEVRRLNRAERMYISLLDTRHPHGLNVSEGGRDRDFPPISDVSLQMNWAFTTHDPVPTDGEARFFSSEFSRDRSGCWVKVPMDVVRKMLLRDGDRVEVWMRYEKVIG